MPTTHCQNQGVNAEEAKSPDEGAVGLVDVNAEGLVDVAVAVT